MENTKIIWITISILLMVVIIIWGLLYFLKKFINTRFKMGIYLDIQKSLKNQVLFLNLINAKSNHVLWNTNEDLLKLYASGTEMNVVFFKTSEVSSGFRIAYATVMSNVDILSLISAIKYNTFEISLNGGITKFHINSIHDKLGEKISKKLEYHGDEESEKHRKEILERFDRKHKYDDFVEDDTRIIAHINEGKTSSTTMRYQAIIPKEYSGLREDEFDPQNIKFFHVYNGYLYELDIEFIDKIENLYEWKIKNLEPATIYPGLSFSIDDGKTILPTTALYGITKDKDGELPTIDDSHLAKPKTGKTKYEIWDQNSSLKQLGKKNTKKNYSILIKKHYEDENPQNYLALSNAYEMYANYKWLGIEEKDLKEDTGELFLENIKII